MATRKKSAPVRPTSGTNTTEAVEWVAGLVPMPGYVNEPGKEPFRPITAMFLTGDGRMLAASVGAPDEGGPSLLEAFAKAMSTPMLGPAHRPARIRIASAELAAFLRQHLDSAIEIDHAPTPELDLIAESMRTYMAERGPKSDPSFLSKDVDPPLMSAFFRAAAKLFRAQPWKILPDDTSVISITCGLLGMNKSVVSVMGQLEQSFGFLLLSSLEEFERYVDEAGAIDSGRRPNLPAHFAVNYEPGSEIHPALRKEISKHQWEVASATAYPWMIAVDTDLVGRAPTRAEVIRTEAICLALSELIEKEPELATIWRTGGVIKRTISVKTAEGTFKMELRAPHEQVRARASSSKSRSSTILEEKRNPDGTLDEEWLETYKDHLLSDFSRAAEAKGLTDIGWVAMLMDYAATFMGVTMAGMTPGHVRTLLFRVLPEKLSADASDTPAIVDQIARFFAFLSRAHHLGNMDACLRVLSPDARIRFAKEMSNPANFGLAKGFVMAGKAEGFDVSTQQGLQAWITESNARQAKRHGVSGKTRPATRKSTRKSAPTPRKKGSLSMSLSSGARGDGNQFVKSPRSREERALLERRPKG